MERHVTIINVESCEGFFFNFNKYNLYHEAALLLINKQLFVSVT